jgi:hypothetical protein
VDDKERERQSQEALERVARESETVGGSSLGRVGRRVGDHFAGTDAVGDAAGGGTDPVELWGRRIGRALSLIGVVVLAYFLGAQLRLW